MTETSVEAVPTRPTPHWRIEVADSALPQLEDTLRSLREALHPIDILSALQALGLDASDLAEGIGVDDRTVRRWLEGHSPSRNHEQTIGALRVLTIHMLQRRGLPVDLVARWLRLPDSSLGFDTPLGAVAKGRLQDAVVAFDDYLAPRPSAVHHVAGGDGDTDEAARPQDAPTGEFAAVKS
jgi:DNA-binding transcriptional regulator YiaG